MCDPATASAVGAVAGVILLRHRSQNRTLIGPIALSRPRWMTNSWISQYFTPSAR
jgi:hypothetical protein